MVLEYTNIAVFYNTGTSVARTARSRTFQVALPSSIKDIPSAASDTWLRTYLRTCSRGQAGSGLVFVGFVPKG